MSPWRYTTAVTWAVIAACAAQFLSAVNLGVAPLLIPQMAEDLGLDPVISTWVIGGYALAFGGFVLLGGRLADVFGGGPILTIGYAVSTASALAVAVAPIGAVLFGARIGQGVGAAVAVPAALSVIAHARQNVTDRGRALAAFAGAGAVGFGLGIVLGGFSAESIGWRWLFVSVAVISALLGVTAHRVTPRRARLDAPIGLLGSITSSTGLLLLAYALTIGARSGWGDPATVSALLAAAAFLGLFVWVQRRSAQPLMPLSIWRQPRFALNIVSALLLYGGWVGAYYFISIVLRDVFELNATGTALAMLPLALGALLGSRVAALLLPRVASAEQLVLAGCLLCATGTAFIATQVDGGSIPAVVLLMLVLVLGQTAAFVGQNISALSAVHLASSGLAASLFNAACQIGGGLAIGLLASVAAAVQDAPSGARGLEAAILGAAMLAAAAGLVVAAPGRRTGGQPD